MRKSKYLNKQFDNGWVCVSVDIASVSHVYHIGTKKQNAYPGHRSYSYTFCRMTGDSKFDKTVKLTASQAAAVYRGDATVEQFENERQAKTRVGKVRKATDKVNYTFLY